MKKFKIFFMISFLLLTILHTSIEASPVNRLADNYNFSTTPVCTNGNLICVLGKYTFSSNNYNKPIYTDIGIMCTSDGNICTNGLYIISSNRANYR